MENKEEKRCLLCKRIIVGNSKLHICPECSRKGKNACNGVIGTLGTVALLYFTKGKKRKN